jgi:hypothetical protein
MTSRELVIRTLEFSGPARVPRQLWTLPWAEAHYPGAIERIRSDFPDDIAHAPEILETPVKTVGDPYIKGTYVDEWGCTFENMEDGYIGEVKTPLLADWQDVDRIRPPKELLTFDVEAVNAFCAESDKFVLSACVARPFERLQFIRKTENLYLDLAMEPDGLLDLIDLLHQFYVERTERWAETDVDALMFMDDWGAQNNTLISLDMWRKLFKPLYNDYIEIAHSHGKYAFMHSDGYITPFIGELAEIGLDAINSQIFCMGVEDLGKRYRGKITFWGEMDRQHLLPYATTEEIADAVRRVYEALYANGGCIAQCEFGAGAKPENVRAMFETWDGVST